MKAALNHSRREEKKSRHSLFLVKGLAHEGVHSAQNAGSARTRPYFSSYLLVLGVFFVLSRFVGIPVRELVQVPTALGVIVITYLIAAKNVGIKAAAQGFVQDLLPMSLGESKREKLVEFTENISTWAILASHLCATAHLIHALVQIDILYNLFEGTRSALSSYFYGGLLAAILSWTNKNNRSVTSHKKNPYEITSQQAVLIFGVVSGIVSIWIYNIKPN